MASIPRSSSKRTLRGIVWAIADPAICVIVPPIKIVKSTWVTGAVVCFTYRTLMQSRTEGTNKAGHAVNALVCRVSIGPPLLALPTEYSGKVL